MPRRPNRPAFRRARAATRRAFGVALGVALSAGLARAEYTVYIENEDGSSYHLQPKSHACIDDPNYFEKVIGANGTLEVHAKWSSACVPGVEPYIKLCLEESGRCYSLQMDSGVKALVIMAGEITEDSDDGFAGD